MTKTEIYQSLSMLRDEIIQARVHLHNAQFQVEYLMGKIQEDIATEPK
jgi:hypothetical protein